MQQRWDKWIEAVRQGDESAAAEFWTNYALPLMRLAERNLQQNIRRRVDPEDIVQSAFRTVLRRMQAGDFSIENDDQLWRLLCAITLNKSRRQVRRHRQLKRNLDREVVFEEDQHLRDAAGPTPDEAAVLVDIVEHMLATAHDEEERSVLLHKLNNLSNLEVADQLQRSERTVRRILQRVCKRMESELAD